MTIITRLFDFAQSDRLITMEGCICLRQHKYLASVIIDDIPAILITISGHTDTCHFKNFNNSILLLPGMA